MARRLSLGGATLLVMLLAGCALPGTRVVLLPQADGSPSAVVVRTKGGEQLVARPYQRATALAGESTAPTLDHTDPETIRAKNKALFDLAPPKPQRFDLFFDAGGTNLTPDSQLELDTIIRAARARSGADITVTGHTDTTGTLEQNDDLSRRRAQQIKQLLIDRGFAAARIEAIGRGERELAVPTANNVDEPRNRRVVILVR